MKWSFRWRNELKTGQYYDLLRKGFIKPHEEEPLIEGLEFYLDAFRELSTSRPVGMDLCAIPFTAIHEYFKIYELEDFQEFMEIIRLLDRTFMDLNEEANKKDRGTNATKHTDKGNKNSR